MTSASLGLPPVGRFQALPATVRAPLFGVLAVVASCAGRIEDVDRSGAGGGGEAKAPETPPGATGPGVGKVGMRRLSVDEYDNTLRALVGDTSRPARRLLPPDVAVPFDNDIAAQSPSDVLVKAVETLAADVTSRLLADKTRRDTVVGCRPKDATDVTCLRSFVTAFGRRALRRPLAPGEVDDFVRLGQEFVQKTGDFYAGVEVFLRAILQDAELVYRVETGTLVAGQPGMFKLEHWQTATRLSFFLWGETPSDALLDLAAAGKLGSPDGVRAAAASMLADARAAARMDRFHALWLGYDQLPHPAALTNAMRRESAALVKRALDQHQPWTDLFLATDTFIDDVLAKHYGLPSPGPGPAWVSYGASGRRGILSHGSFLSSAGNFTDTSPTKRGKLIRTQLFCQDIPPPPPTVKADEPPKASSSPCKWERYGDHRQQGSACVSCHEQIDPIGFGLENYDKAGAFRTTDPGLPQCPIKGEGELVGIGKFHGPAELAAMFVKEEKTYSPCIAERLYRFAMGHKAADEDLPFVEELTRKFNASGHRLSDLVLDLVSTPAFGYRLED